MNEWKKKCSMCGEYKTIDQYRFMQHRQRHNAYCRDCEKWYQRHYVRKDRIKSEVKENE